MSKQQLKIFIMTIIVGAFLALLGTTYAYYQVRIIENTEEKSISVQSKVLEVTYEDTDEQGVITGSINGYVFPGETITKKFTVRNTGDDIASYNIILRDITNTFSRTGDWTYTLKVGDTVLTDPEWITFPTTTDKVIIYLNRSLQVGASETYTLILSYANSEEDQSVDMNQELTATVDIEAAE